MKKGELRVVEFHGDEIVTFERAGVRYVAMRRICENIGLDWARQSVKLNEIKEKLNCCHMPTVAADGKEREPAACHLDMRRALSGQVFDFKRHEMVHLEIVRAFEFSNGLEHTPVLLLEGAGDIPAVGEGLPLSHAHESVDRIL